MVANMGDQAAFLRYFTLFTLFDPRGIVASGLPAMGGCLALFFIAAALFTAGAAMFERRDLAL